MACGPKWMNARNAAPPPERNAQNPGPTRPEKYRSRPIAIAG
jgi:hypothetical protein